MAWGHQTGKKHPHKGSHAPRRFFGRHFKGRHNLGRRFFGRQPTHTPKH